MKKNHWVSIIVVFTLLVSGSLYATGLRKNFLEYEITPMEDLYLGKQAEKVWQLSYSQEEVPVTIVKKKNLDGTNYIVRTAFFEVNYLAGPEGFGAMQVKKHWSMVPKQITMAVINQEELARQRIITPNPVDDKKALEFIACYLPYLIHDNYTHLLK
jgi:hypothetical protein